MFLLGVSVWFYKIYQDNKIIPNLKKIEITYYQDLFQHKENYYQDLFKYKEAEYQKQIDLLLKDKEQLKSEINKLNVQIEKIQTELLTILRS